jgi:hypothetical protein
VKPAQTAAVIAARRQQTQDKLGQVEQAIAQLRRERGRLTVRSIADRAGVYATFLYENSDTRLLVQQSTADSQVRRNRAAAQTHDRVEASWREPALNAEAELGRTQQEVKVFIVNRDRIPQMVDFTFQNAVTAQPIPTLAV